MVDNLQEYVSTGDELTTQAYRIVRLLVGT